MTCNSKRNVNWNPLEIIVTIVKERAPLLTSLVQSIGPLSKSVMTSYLALMKLLIILVILYKSAHCNHSNYFPLLVAIYLYLARAKVDTIILLNYLRISVSYDVLLKKLRSIMSSNATFIKQQSTNCKLIKIWYNFEYWENIVNERIGDIVKFGSLTMAL